MQLFNIYVFNVIRLIVINIYTYMYFFKGTLIIAVS